MYRFIVHILLSFLALHTFAAPPFRLDGPPLPGQYRAILPSEALNKADPDVYIRPPGHPGNSRPHPGLILEGPNPKNRGRLKALVITHNLGKAPGARINDIDRATTLTGDLSYKKPMEFKDVVHHVGSKYRVNGRPVSDMSPTTLDRVKQRVMPGAAAGNTSQQGSSSAPQPPQPQRDIKPLPKRKGVPVPGKPPTGAVTFSMPKPKANITPGLNVLDPKGAAPVAGSKRKSTSPSPTSSKRRNISPGASSNRRRPSPGAGSRRRTPSPVAGSRQRSPSPGAGSKRRNPSPGARVKKPRLSRRDYLGLYYRLA